MAKFVTIGYGDQAGYDRTDAAVRDGAHAHDARLRRDGVDMGVAGQPVQVRNHDGAEVRTETGPFRTTPPNRTPERPIRARTKLAFKPSGRPRPGG